MAQYDQLTELLDLPNTHVIHYQLVGHHRLNLFVESTLEAAICPTCQRVSVSVHDRGEPLFIRDLAIWNRRCWLRYVPRRFECAACQATFGRNKLCVRLLIHRIIYRVAERVLVKHRLSSFS
jgi:hypothetical protein